MRPGCRRQEPSRTTGVPADSIPQDDEPEPRPNPCHDMTFNSLPPEVDEQLATVRKAVDSLRAAAANHRPPEVLEPSNAAVRLRWPRPMIRR